MLIDDDYLNAVAEVYREIVEQYQPSMTFSDALRVCHTRDIKYVLQQQLVEKAERFYEKQRLQNGYEYGCGYMSVGVRPAIYCLGE